MIEYVTGNLLESNAEALVNAVNTVGVMGKGIALQFREAFPENYRAYRNACKRGDVQLGQMFVTDRQKPTGPRWIINFPTKGDWRSNSRLEDIEVGLGNLVALVRSEKIVSIAIPQLGCGNGSLDWKQVLPLIESAFRNVETKALVYGPPA